MHLISNIACGGPHEPADDSKPPEFMSVRLHARIKNSAAGDCSDHLRAENAPPEVQVLIWRWFQSLPRRLKLLPVRPAAYPRNNEGRVDCHQKVTGTFLGFRPLDSGKR